MGGAAAGAEGGCWAGWRGVGVACVRHGSEVLERERLRACDLCYVAELQGVCELCYALL